MRRDELEHIIRAAGAIADVDKIIIFGSQSILAQFPDLDKIILENKVEISSVSQIQSVLYGSVEADIIVPDSEEKTELIEGTIGELSFFHKTFGYYAQGVDLNTSKLPKDWDKRLVEIYNDNTNGISGMCLEIHDLIISNLTQVGKKTLSFFGLLLASGYYHQ